MTLNGDKPADEPAPVDTETWDGLPLRERLYLLLSPLTSVDLAVRIVMLLMVVALVVWVVWLRP